MKKLVFKLALIAVIGIAFIGCDNSNSTKPGYTIDLTIANTTMDSAFLFILGAEGWETKDSVALADGKFHFEGEFEVGEYIAIGDRKRDYSVRLLAGNNPIMITSDFDSPGQDSIVGSVFNDEYMAIQDSLSLFDNQLQEIIQQYQIAQQNSDSVQMQQLEKNYESLSGIKDNWMVDWVRENPGSLVAQFLIINPLMYTVSFEELVTLYDNISLEISNTNMYKMIQYKVETMQKSAVGQMAPEITMVDTNGVEQTLSSHFGTYLLIDFWASWCGPCRADNPQMVSIYHKYHEFGYNVFGVSLDEKRDRWLKAINTDELVWSHVSDLKGWKSEGAKTYGVSSIPHTVLVDPDGIIIARGLRGDELEAKLAEIFASKVQ